MPVIPSRQDETPAQQTLLAGFSPFPPQRAAAYRAAGYWAGRSVDSVLRDAAKRWPDSEAIVDGVSKHTYAELDELVDQAAAGFAALGIGPADRVLVQLPNSCRFVVTLFGLLRAGAIPVMCLPGHRQAELAHFAEVSGAVGLVIKDSANGFDYCSMAEQLTAAYPQLRNVIVDGNPGPFLPWSQLPTGDTPEIHTDPSSPALLLVSGGTTGPPKLIPRTHDDYVYNATASAQLCGFTKEDVYFVVLPAAHNFPLACPGILGAMTVGAKIVLGADPSPEAAFAAIDRHRVTATALVPALALLWARACDWEPVLPSTLRLLQVGGAKLGPEDARMIRAALTSGLQQVFGMAEGLLCYTRLDDSAEVIEHTQGRPLSAHDEVRVVDQAGQELPHGKDGELLVRGPYTLNGYFNAERDNQQAFSPDGFYRTGDQVRRLPNGYLEVTGRIKDVIHRAGETISAPELEAHLMAHPSIWAAAAVPLPDDLLGEKICAAVVFAGPALNLAEVNDYLNNRGVAAHARPDMVVSVPDLPTTAVGKVDKRAVAAQLGG